MSMLKSKLEELTAPKLSPNIVNWFNSLSDEDKNLAWGAMENSTLKSYTLLKIFRAEGMKASKDTFIPFRRDVLEGKIKRTEIDE